MMQGHSNSAACTSQQEEETSNNTNSAVATSLDNFVLSRMRTSALQKWQPKPPHSTPDSSRNDTKSKEEPETAQEVPSYLSCPLCFEDKSKPEVYALSQCSHEFCRDCLGQWSKKAHEGSSVPSCPLCRGSITSEDRSAILGPSTLFLQDEDMSCVSELSYGSDDDIPLTISPRLGPFLYAEDLLDVPSISLESRFSFMGWV
jgi:Ring finger domain